MFETLAEAIREAKSEDAPRPERKPRPKPRPRVAKPAPVRKPPNRTHTPVSQRSVIDDREQRRELQSEQRLGHVAEGLVAPPQSTYGEPQIVGASVDLQGVDLRKAIILTEILGPPVSIRQTDDYFSP